MLLLDPISRHHLSYGANSDIFRVSANLVKIAEKAVKIGKMVDSEVGGSGVSP